MRKWHTAVVPSLGSPDVLGIKFPEAFTRSYAGHDSWELSLNNIWGPRLGTTGGVDKRFETVLRRPEFEFCLGHESSLQGGNGKAHLEHFIYIKHALLGSP